MPAPDFYAMAARAAYSLPPEWQPLTYRSCGPIGVELLGAEPIGTYRSGRYKGQPKFPPLQQMRQVFVTREQIEQAATAWQQATGLCTRCGGDGQVVTRIDRSGDVGHKACDACSGSGTGQAVAP
jgi:hypothetical protein